MDWQQLSYFLYMAEQEQEQEEETVVGNYNSTPQENSPPKEQKQA